MKKIILDCDPGHDDMVAIILACASDGLDILGITTVAGNQTGDKTLLNALKTLTLIGEKNIPVAGGFDRPLTGKLVTAPHIHGLSGLDGADLPDPEIKPLKIHAVDFIELTLMKADEKVTVIATGPLTNIAVLLLKSAQIKEKIERIIIMGGAVYESNITPSAEFNIYVDPEAAGIVLNSGIPVTMVTLDVSNKAIFTLEDIDNIKSLNGKVSRVVSGLLRFFAEANIKSFGFEGAPLHDPITVAYAVDPDIIETELYHVDIETKGEYTRGKTVVDVYGVTKKNTNAEISVSLDLARYKDLITGAVKKFD
ncbi:MAG TPA: nucleoside hydrolase [Spirochaetes bacterium]|nr:nucleoside hydrolase [Spirochaetota bacterium]